MKNSIKKHYMVLVALFIAGVTMMSFTHQNNQTSINDEIWFLMNSAGTEITTTQIDDPDNVCLEPLDDNCARAYHISQTEANPAPEGGIRVKPLEVDNQSASRGRK